HGMFLKEPYRLSVFHANTLIKMYSGFGNIEYARQVFDEMPDRNGASWNNMISGYIRTGSYSDSLILFLQMWRGGFELNGYNIPSLLTACARSGTMLLEGLQIHSLVLKSGLSSDVFVGTSLLHFYGVYRFILDARNVFDEMTERNVVSWTSLMVNYADAGFFYEVFDLYRKMKFEGVSCNQNTFSTVVSSCKPLDDKLLVHQVLVNVIKSGLETNVSISNSLISVFGSFGEIEIAASIFKTMDEHDTISWNSMLGAFADNRFLEESLEYFRLMRLYHGEIDESTVSTMLSVCDSKCGRGIHCLVLKLGFDADICVSNTLISMYFETGSCRDAERHFHLMPSRDSITWNSIIAGYASVGNWFGTLRVLRELLRFDEVLNFVSFASSLASCADAELLSEGMILHGLVITHGMNHNDVVGNALVAMYGKCGSTEEAAKIFRHMPEKGVVTWNSLIGCYSENEETDEAIRTYNSMRRAVIISPNYITLVNVLGSFRDPNHLRMHGVAFHGHIVSIGFESDEYVKNSLITMYTNCGDLESSGSIFSTSVEGRSPATWNAMVAAMARSGCWEEALRLLHRMRREDVKTDQFSLSAALSSSANLAVLEAGQQLHCLSVKTGFDGYRFVANAATDMYGKCGELKDLAKLLPQARRRSTLSWNVAISAFARHGDLRKVRETFREMVSTGSNPDHVTFVSLLSAFSHGGMVSEGLECFELMTRAFGVPPAIEHCVCIVDLLGRSGRLSEAEAFVEQMPIPPNDFIWRSLLASSKIHGDVELSRRAAENLLATNPSDDSAYSLYSGVCATSGKWENVVGLRMKMNSDNVKKKKPALSWLNVR
ncbi:hypothetical protein M569_09347, partial [Genlisea aurea]